MTKSSNERSVRERAHAAICAALCRAAANALAAGVRPAALIRYGDDRIAALLRSAPSDPAANRGE